MKPAPPTTTLTVVRGDDGVAVVTLYRPERHNAIDRVMGDELAGLWRSLRGDGSVRAIVLTGAGDRAFCSGTDPASAVDDEAGRLVGPKSNGLWTPVIAAVNGLAAGGAFRLLGEAEFIIAAEHATFFDPQLTDGVPAVYEPTLMAARMPIGEITRLTLLGDHERMSARRAYDIGLVSEVVPAAGLLDAARWAASAIAGLPPAAVQATVRTLWAARELTRRQALDLGPALLAAGVASGSAAGSGAPAGPASGSGSASGGRPAVAAERPITPRVR